MLDVVEADRFPDVCFTLTAVDSIQTINETTSLWKVRGSLAFHGVTQPVSIPVTLTYQNSRVIAHTLFSIRLSDFKVKRPKLLLMRIKDTIDIEARWVGRVHS